jgi:uncharacterized membrane protein YbhN (UPF0104 family)
LRDRLATLLKLLISVVLIVWAFSRVDLRQVGAQLKTANLWLFAAALLTYLAAIAVNAVKWQVLLRAQGVRISFPALLRFQFVGFFFNNFLPQVGGDVMRGYGLARYTDHINTVHFPVNTVHFPVNTVHFPVNTAYFPVNTVHCPAPARTAEPGGWAAAAAVSVIVDRIVGLMAYMSTAAVAAFITVTFGGHGELRSVAWVAILALAILALGFGVLLSRRLRGLAGKLFAWRLFARLAPLWGRVSDAFNAYRFQYAALALAFGVALLGIICTTLVNWLLSQAIGGLMTLPTILLFNPLIALVLMIPISIGGLGVNQAAFPFFYNLARVPADHSLAVSLLMQAVIVLGSLPGGVFWLKRKT